jgi:4-hydroxy-tetrahydrodipicolinate synthase
MPRAREAREWAADGGLRGLGDSLYTPFSGTGGDQVDMDAYRRLVRYCVGDLEHEMLWLTSGIGEWWSLTLDERKLLVEVAVDEARAVAPDTVIQACTAASSAKDSLELTQHAQSLAVDICFLQTPSMEVHGGEGVLRFFRYVADRTDIALGLFNSPSSGYVMTAGDMARIHQEIPAVVAVKEGVQDSVRNTLELHALAPDLLIWECDFLVYRARWLQEGIVMPAQLGGNGYLVESPGDRRYRGYWERIWAGEIAEAIEYARETGLDALTAAMGSWTTRHPARPDYFTHWGAAYRFAATQCGLPVGDYEHSRPPQGVLPDEAKVQIRAAYERYGPKRPATVNLGAR